MTQQNKIQTEAAYELPVRIYYEDTDAGGIVYYANYLKFMERARTEWLREMGFEQDQLRDEYGVIFVVRSVNIEYFKPALFNDLLSVTVSITDLGRTHITCKQQVYKSSEDSASDVVSSTSSAKLPISPISSPISPTKKELITEAMIGLVCIDAARFRPKRIPDHLRGSFSY